MKRSALAVAIVISLAMAASLDAGPITFLPALPVAEKQGVLRLQYLPGDHAIARVASFDSLVERRLVGEVHGFLIGAHGAMNVVLLLPAAQRR